MDIIKILYDVPVGFVTPPPPYIEAVYCFICGRRRVAVARYRMICLFFVMQPLVKWSNGDTLPTVGLIIEMAYMLPNDVFINATVIDISRQ